jgi:hypothetical protein
MNFFLRQFSWLFWIDNELHFADIDDVVQDIQVLTMREAISMCVYQLDVL